MNKIQLTSKKEHARTFAQITPSGKFPFVLNKLRVGQNLANRTNGYLK